MAVLASALEQSQRRRIDQGPLEQGLAMNWRQLGMKGQPSKGHGKQRYRKERSSYEDLRHLFTRLFQKGDDGRPFDGVI